MVNKRLSLGVDLGGTHLRTALIDERGKILEKISKDVGNIRDEKPLLKFIADSLREAAGKSLSQVEGIGVGLPGICDFKTGIVHQLPHFPRLKDFSAKDFLQKEFSCPIIIDNDANMAALGEHWLGVAKKIPSFIMLTLGTGIGGGIFLDGKLWRGTNGFAGEVGHMTIVPDGRLCPCGNKGCWEMYAASHAATDGKSMEELHQLAKNNDKKALNFWQNFGQFLGIGIANLMHILDLNFFVLGGGIASASEYFLESAYASAKARSYRKLGDKLIIRPSVLEGSANILGCAASILNPQ